MNVPRSTTPDKASSHQKWSSLRIRENQSREVARELASRNGHGGGVSQHPGSHGAQASPL